MRFFLPVLALLGVATAAHAQPETFRLTDEQKQELLAKQVEKDIASPTESRVLNDRRPHGEVGVMVGTGGARGIYGITSVPLGQTGSATFGFENSQNVYREGPYGPYGNYNRFHGSYRSDWPLSGW